MAAASRHASAAAWGHHIEPSWQGLQHHHEADPPEEPALVMPQACSSARLTMESLASSNPSIKGHIPHKSFTTVGGDMAGNRWHLTMTRPASRSASITGQIPRITSHTRAAPLLLRASWACPGRCCDGSGGAVRSAEAMPPAQAMMWKDGQAGPRPSVSSVMSAAWVACTHVKGYDPPGYQHALCQRSVSAGWNC